MCSKIYKYWGTKMFHFGHHFAVLNKNEYPEKNMEPFEVNNRAFTIIILASRPYYADVFMRQRDME